MTPEVLPENVKEWFSLASDVALVTGAASGIGKATAKALAGAGASVLCADVNREGAVEIAAAITKAGGRAWPLEVDIARPESVEAMVHAALVQVPAIDVLVNVAGYSAEFTTPEDLDRALWDRTIAVNLTGTFMCAQAIGRHMITHGVRGRIINIASTAALYAPKIRGRAMTAYSASKAGVVMVTRTLAAAWAGHGIRVNAVAPGMVVTPMTERTRANRVASEAMIEATPMRRFGQPEEIAAAVLFLAAPASNFITGQILIVDGGFNV